MSRGIDLARAGAPEHATAIEEMLPQLLIALVKRAGGKLVIPVAEVDDTGGNLLMFSVDPVMRTFNFEVRKKQ